MTKIFIFHSKFSVLRTNGKSRINFSNFVGSDPLGSFGSSKCYRFLSFLRSQLHENGYYYNCMYPVTINCTCSCITNYRRCFLIIFFLLSTTKLYNVMYMLHMPSVCHKSMCKQKCLLKLI